MPVRDPEKKREIGRRYEAKRRSCTRRLRLALEVLEEYGLTDRFELRCRDEGIEHPLLIPHGRER